MVRVLVVALLGSVVLAAGCGDSLAGSEGTSSEAATWASTGEGMSGSTRGDVPTGDGSEAGTADASTGTTGPDTDGDGGSTETGEPAANCYQGGIATAVAERSAERLAGFNCITGDVTIYEHTGPDLWFLGEIRSIGGGFTVYGPNEIVSLKGLEKLESVGWGRRASSRCGSGGRRCLCRWGC